MCPTPTAQSGLCPGKDLVVIGCDRVGDRDSLQAMMPQVDILLLPQHGNGVVTITQMLINRYPIHRLHLVMPGQADGLHLGTASLQYNNLPTYARDLCQWKSVLAPGAEILIYNGVFARTEAGRLFIDVLHYLTGAAIAACTNPATATVDPGRWEFDCAHPAWSPSFVFGPPVIPHSDQPPKQGVQPATVIN